MRIEDVPEEYRDSPIVRAIFAEKPDEAQRELLSTLDRAHRTDECWVLGDVGR